MRSLTLFSLGALTGQFYLTVASASTACTAISPQPSDICGIRGKIKYRYQEDYDSLALPQLVDTVEECAELCARRIESKDLNQTDSSRDGLYDYCSSFKLNTKTNLCQLGLFSISNRTQENPNSDFVFYNPGCFDCGPPCRQPFGTQILDNGRFEDGLLGPWEVADYGYSHLNSLGKGYNSLFSLHSGQGKVLQEVNLCEYSLYAIQFDYVALQTSKQKQAEIEFSFGGTIFSEDFYSREGTGLFVNTISTNNTDRSAWKPKRLYFPYKFGGHVGPQFEFGTGSFFIDNVRVERVPSNPAVKKGIHSLLVNGGWETGTIAGWTYRQANFYTRNFTVVSPGLDSKYALEYKANANIRTAQGPYLSQTIATTPNTTYLFSFDAQVFFNEVEFYLSIGPPHDRLDYSEYYLPGNHTFSVPVLATTHSLKLNFTAGYFEERYHGRMLMDNFKVLELEKSKFFP